MPGSPASGQADRALRILSVIGTRPESIKMAPVLRQLAEHRERVTSIVCVTSQHRELLDQMLSVFGIRPDYDLDLMQPDQSLSRLTSALFAALEPVIAETRPDWIVAQGDTTTVAVTALVAFYHGIPFGHVEAGLRTGDRRQPFPEEMNRWIADRVGDLLFAPTDHNRRTLLAEGIEETRIVVTGNTVVDALVEVAARPYDWSVGPLAKLPAGETLVLITAHRRESFGVPFRALCTALRELARTYAARGVHFVYPVHLNPNVREPATELLAGLRNVSLIEPLDYVSMVQLMKRATLILSDSGGIQEEAPTFGVPVLVLREVTERPEGVEAGVAKVVGTDPARIVTEARRLLDDPAAHRAMSRRGNPYGDGQAAARIVAALLAAGRRR